MTLLRLSTSLLANVEDQKDICGCDSSPGLEKEKNKKQNRPPRVKRPTPQRSARRAASYSYDIFVVFI